MLHLWFGRTGEMNSAVVVQIHISIYDYELMFQERKVAVQLRTAQPHR